MAKRSVGTNATTPDEALRPQSGVLREAKSVLQLGTTSSPPQHKFSTCLSDVALRWVRMAIALISLEMQVFLHGSGFTHNDSALGSHGQYCPPCAHPENVEIHDLVHSPLVIRAAFATDLLALVGQQSCKIALSLSSTSGSARVRYVVRKDSDRARRCAVQTCAVGLGRNLIEFHKHRWSINRESAVGQK
jgi:hypothetical protein